MRFDQYMVHKHSRLFVHLRSLEYLLTLIKKVSPWKVTLQLVVLVLSRVLRHPSGAVQGAAAQQHISPPCLSVLPLPCLSVPPLPCMSMPHPVHLCPTLSHSTFFSRPELLRDQHYAYLKRGLRHLSDAYEVRASGSAACTRLGPVSCWLRPGSCWLGLVSPLVSGC